ncbi:MAG TPA: metallophosphoesterase [Candidatus Magasanikbacteria bacterium]|nr:metallophosphoesterase [Candidatus Magasanikbacteria bacterium]
MNFYTIIIYGYIFIALLLAYFIIRDSKQKNLFFNRHKKLAYSLFFVLIFGIFCALYAHLIEPFILINKKIDVQISSFEHPVKIAFITDIQAGKHKKTQWIEKIVQKTLDTNPDLVIFGGDLIDNEGVFEDESIYLESLKKISDKYPSFYVLGNHEYGLGQMDLSKRYLGTGNKTKELIDQMKKNNIILLRNNLHCFKIKEQDLCLFGIDDIYAGKKDYSELKNLPADTPLLFITHNPDGVLGYPKIFKKPDLVLAGHTHGGQVYLPIIGPIGSVDLILQRKFYRGLNYWENTPIYTSVGVGESGGQIRFLSFPEIILFTLTP